MSDKIDKQVLIKQVLEIATSLGRTPTYDEFKAGAKRGGGTIAKYFGSYTVLVQAAGLEAPLESKRLSNKIFEVNIDKHLDAYHQSVKTKVIQEPFPEAAIISDIHWPFENKKVVKRFIEYCGDEKPEWAIINGDGWDMFSHGRFPRSHNIFTPREEERKARELNVQFWKEVQRASPKSKCIQMLGNHDIRPIKRIMESYPEAEDWIKEKLQELFTFKNVKTFHDPREELFLNSQTTVFHGYRTKLGDHRDYTLYSTCNGHSHVGGVVFRKIRGMVLFELNSGLAGDPEAKGLTYTPQKITVWTPGFGAINKYGPQFVSVS